METNNQSVSRIEPEVACVFSHVVYRDPLVRLAFELRAVYAQWGAIEIAPSMRSIKLALRGAAVQLDMPALPAWWAAVPQIRLIDLLLWLHDEDGHEVFPPHAELRVLIEDATRVLAAQEASL
jgi:hypothetical protein